MSKLIYDEQMQVMVEYSVKNGSFDHEFGVRDIKDYLISEVHIYSDVLNWVLLSEMPPHVEAYITQMIADEEE